MTARVSGDVQGVGFRWFVRREASRLGLSGSAVNAPDGSVDVVAEGPRDACEGLVDLMRGRARPPGRVDRVTVDWGEPHGLRGFIIG
jgi:acylphosphatase